MSKPFIQPYLFFGGRCEEAIAFYRDAIGAVPEMSTRYDQSPESSGGRLPAGFEKKIMHAQFKVGDSLIMCSDGCAHGQAHDGYSLAIAFPTEAEVDRAFAKLSAGGSVVMPLAKTFWSPKFGMCKDQFGVTWFVSIAEQR
jgi:PhnB protein